ACPDAHRPESAAAPARHGDRGPWRSPPLVVLAAGFSAQRRGGGLDLSPVVEDFDAALRLFEPRVTEARELHAALEELERFLEREVPLLERLDDRLELGDRRFEVFDGRVHGFQLSALSSQLSALSYQL